MKKHLAKIENHLHSLDAAAQAALAECSEVKQFKKGEHLLQAGEICRGSYWIQQGVARKYYLREGKEITTELFFETDLAVSLQSYTLQQSSDEYIQAIEDVTVSITYFSRFQKAKELHASLLQLDLMLTEYYAMWLEQRLWQFHSLDATQRYALLLAEQPHFVRQIPLTYLASYLGVSLETLSRIRAKV